jgi:peroxin-2
VLSPVLLARFRPEAAAALEALVFLRTIARGAPTPGLALLGLRFVDERRWWRRRINRREEGSNNDAAEGETSALPSPSSTHLLPLSPAQRTSYGLATVAMTYAWDRSARSGLLASLAESPEGSRAHGAARLLRNAETATSVAALVNSVLFLAQRSRYRSLLEAVPVI